MSFAKSAFVIGLVAAVAACYGDASSSSSGGGASGGGPSYGEEDASTSAQPMLAFVDPGRTLNAQPGQGVGVFVTYQIGGTWVVAWTCDTSITNESCFFQISVNATNGSSQAQLLSQSIGPTDTVVTQPLPAGESPVQTALVIDSTVTTQQDEVTFTTTPGATISVGVELNGVPSGQYFFFVQNGVVNGNYQGALSDPMEFEPTSP
jgi:hypothetical protein